MKISVRWLNEYLEPANVTPEEAERVLTFAGFPIESAESLPTGDTCLDVEVTSNRGDVLCHIGVAREIAAVTGRRLKLPAANKTFDWAGPSHPSVPAPSPVSSSLNDIGSALAIDNRVPEACPLFTARILRDLTIAPSPPWLVEALAAVGQRSINNIVDVTNFVSFEYGQPTHVFDLSTIHTGPDNKARVVIRTAGKGEKLELLDGQTITLAGDETVVADEDVAGTPRAISLAGIMGGKLTQVTNSTTDVLFEAATWDPLNIRKTARRHALRSDASYRFERLVDPRTIEVAAKRAAALMLKLGGGGGGRLVPGVIHAGAPGADTKPLRQVQLRPSRCRVILGLNVQTPKIQEVLEAHDIAVVPAPAAPQAAEPLLACTVPAHRPDLEREIDLIEEIARTVGLDKLPVHEKLPIRVAAPQSSERAMRELAAALTGLGFFETITFTFISPAMAKPFTPANRRTLEVTDGRRKADPILRPSVLPSLLHCRKANQDAGNAAGDAGIRLYEIASVFTEIPGKAPKDRGKESEYTALALIADASFSVTGAGKSFDQRQTAVRFMRGVIESLVTRLGGSEAKLDITPAGINLLPAFDPAASATVSINNEPVGVLGLITPAVQKTFDLSHPVVAAELDLQALITLFPPKATVTALPLFPAIERDLSLIVSEKTPWAAVASLVRTTKVDLLEDSTFVTTYRGPQAGPGKKSVTLRLRFRDPARTLRHDEVDPQVETVVKAAERQLGATIRVV